MRERVAAVGRHARARAPRARRLPRAGARSRCAAARRRARVIRVLLVDDQALVRARVPHDPRLGGRHRGRRRGGDGAEAVAAVAELAPDVVCMDVQMPGMDGLEATRRIMADAASTAAVLVLTTFNREDYLFAALEAGASGFLLKNAEPRAAHRGGAGRRPRRRAAVAGCHAAGDRGGSAGPAPTTAPTPRLTPGRDAAAARRLATLTEREREVLRAARPGHLERRDRRSACASARRP